MLEQAVSFTITNLNEYFLKKTGTADLVVANTLSGEANVAVPVPEKKVTLTIVGIEEDRVTANRTYFKADEQNYQLPEVRVNLMLLFTSTHKNYDDKLQNLSHVITFFQTHPLLTNTTVGIKHLSFELQTLTFEQQSYIWGLLSLKYQPSVVYRMRVVALRDKEVMKQGVEIQVLEIAP